MKRILANSIRDSGSTKLVSLFRIHKADLIVSTRRVGIFVAMMAEVEVCHVGQIQTP